MRENLRTGLAVQHFRDAVLAGGIVSIAATLDADVHFFSPAFDEPTIGRDTVAAVLARARAVYGDMTFEETSAQREAAVLFFRAQVAGAALQGCYRLRVSGEGKVSRIDALMRPVGATQALVVAMMSGGGQDHGGRPPT